MHLTINSIHEARPGPKWQALFEGYWPLYKKWFLSEGYLARPGYMTSRKKLGHFMPELLPIYDELVALAGGGDVAARFLSCYCPPPYLSGCSQAVWPKPEPLLVRNYDYSPHLFEGNLLYTNWLRPVIAMSDSLWGVLDGLNEAGLVVSLTFGGRKVVGDGFGVPLLLRYLLEVCADTPTAREILPRIPVHMPYNVTVLDRQGAFLTAYLAPDRPAVITTEPVGTNHQEEIEWLDYARLTSTVERKTFLEERLADTTETEPRFLRRFLFPPLYNTEFEKAFGTLYTAIYRPLSQTAEYRWPRQAPLTQSFTTFTERKTVINLTLARASFKTKTVS
jgi:predicted choloylglycine hydrolase